MNCGTTCQTAVLLSSLYLCITMHVPVQCTCSSAGSFIIVIYWPIKTAPGRILFVDGKILLG